MNKETSRKIKHGKCYYCHSSLFNLKGSYRHVEVEKALICVKIRDGRRIIDELGYDLFYGEYRQIKQIDPNERVWSISS